MVPGGTIGVPNIWRFEGSDFHIHPRQVIVNYLEVERGLALPFLDPDEVVFWMQKDDNDVNWKRQA